MFSHPRLAFDRSTGALLVAAIANEGARLNRIYMNRLVGNNWQRPVLVSHETSGISINIGSENLRFAFGFSFDVGASSGTRARKDLPPRVNSDHIRLMYTTRDAETQRLYVRGAACRFDLTDCDDVPEWGTTPGNLHTPGQQWNPAVRAWPGFIGLPPVWKVAYQSTDDSPNGISWKQGNLAVLPNGTPAFIPFDLVGPRPVCPDFRGGSPGHAQGGYWGDYDEMTLAGFDGGTVPDFLLAFSDSSKGCLLQYMFTSEHVHVSSVVFK